MEAALFCTLRSASPPDQPPPTHYAGATNNSSKIGSLAKMFEQENGDGRPSSPSKTLNEVDMIQAISHLSFLAERLLDNAARLLTLPSLITFLTFLCRASCEQQVAHSKGTAGSKESVAGFHIRRFTSLLLAVCSKSQRPLLHLLRAWATVSQHLVEVSGTSIAHSINHLLKGVLIATEVVGVLREQRVIAAYALSLPITVPQYCVIPRHDFEFYADCLLQ